MGELPEPGESVGTCESVGIPTHHRGMIEIAHPSKKKGHHIKSVALWRGATTFEK